ncbi:hypothetical protein HFP43_14905 [Streptomyces sp. SJ1-7]|nr:hypothetical protein [Streptomyces sp. SJ1-7]
MALLVAVSVATPVLLGGASAVADPVSKRPRPVQATEGTTSDDRRSARSGGLVTGLRRVPAEFLAGGAWREFDLVLTNITGKEMSDFTLDFQVITYHPDPSLLPSHMSVRARLDGSWQDMELWDMGARDVDVLLPVEGMTLPPGETVIPMRMKFSGDAPSVRFFLGPRADEDHAESCDEDYWEVSEIVRGAGPGPDPEPSAGPGPSTGPSSDPSPVPSADPSASMDPGHDPSADPSRGPSVDPSREPSVDPGREPSVHPGPASSPGSGPGPATASAHPLPAPEFTQPGTGPSGAASDAGDHLARTGSDTATTMVLGIGGALILLGAVFAVVGRRAARRGGRA